MSTEDGNENSTNVVKEITLGKLRAGEQPFSAWGYSILRVSRGEEIVNIKVPIKSIGVSEVSDRISRKSPVPPITKRYLQPTSEEGKSLGLKAPRVIEVENYADATYKEQLTEHNRMSAYRLVLAGLALDIEDTDGTKVVESISTTHSTRVIDEDKAIEILKSQGISAEHFSQLYDDIKALTEKEKERIDLE